MFCVLGWGLKGRGIGVFFYRKISFIIVCYWSLKIDNFGDFLFCFIFVVLKCLNLYLLWVRFVVKSFICMVYVTVFLLFFIYRWGNRGTRRFDDLGWILVLGFVFFLIFFGFFKIVVIVFFNRGLRILELVGYFKFDYFKFFFIL